LRRLVPLVLSLALGLPAEAQSPHTHEHRFSDAEKWARVFDDPARDAWQKPGEVIEALALAADAVVADIGAGTGYFAARLARALPKGTVYATDVEADMVKHLEQRARREGLPNLKAVASTPSDARVPQEADLVLFVDVYHHIADREAYFKRLAASLKRDGRVAIIDFRLDSPQGPPKRARVAPENVKAELTKAGYALAAEHSFLPYQYFLVFRPSR
jgi:predicted methyltransferase